MSETDEPEVDERTLEALITDGLVRRFERRAPEFARWIVSGATPRPEWSTPSMFSYYPADDAQNAMMAAVTRAEPIVEWRLATAIGLQSRRGPLGALSVLFYDLERDDSLTDERLHQMLTDAGVTGSEFVREVMKADRYTEYWKATVRRRPLFVSLASAHPDAVSDELLHDPRLVDATAEALVTALGESSDEVLAPIVETIVELASDTRKKRKNAGARLAQSVSYDRLAPEFARVATHGTASQRGGALRAWAHRAGDEHIGDVAAFAASRRAEDGAVAVQDAAREIEELASNRPTLAPTAWPEVDTSEPGAAGHAAFAAMIDATHRHRYDRYVEAVELLNQDPAPTHGVAWAHKLVEKPPQRIPDDLIDRCWRYVCTGNGGADVEGRLRREHCDTADLVLDDFGSLHLFRLGRLWEAESLSWPMSVLAERYETTGHPTALETQAAAERADVERIRVVRAFPNPVWGTHDEVGEWAGAVLPAIASTIETGKVGSKDHLAKYYDVVSTLPTLPIELQRLLEIQAVGQQRVRQLARRTLGDRPGVRSAATEFLSSRKSQQRAAAAGWLVELGAAEAVPALHQAAERERNEAALGAELTALDGFGESVERHLSPSVVGGMVERELNKGMPAAGRWIPISLLETLRWNDGSDVDPQVVAWLLVQAVRLKSTVPSPIVRSIFARMETATVRHFASQLIELWIAEDLRPLPVDEASRRAQTTTWLPAGFRKRAGATGPVTFEEAVEYYTTVPADSALGSKGLLSLVSAGGDDSVLAPVETYLLEQPRVDQSKALLDMLERMDLAAAPHAMFVAARRSESKAVRAAASRAVTQAAEGRGLTVEQFADRTVPDGGFDASGARELGDGDDVLVARLTDDLDIVVTAGTGERADRQRSQGALARARVQVAAVAEEQTARLHDSMRSRRRYERDDFDRYVVGHPVMVRLASRLVWAAVRGEERTLFRPLSDGTLVGVDDDEVDIATADYVTLAGRAVDGRLAAWRRHFGDYDLVPLFRQF